MFLGVPRARAASLILVGSSTVSSNQDFKVDVMVDAGNDNLNAFGGSISFPNRLLEVKSINDGDSIVNFWIDRPSSSSTGAGAGIISWNGITPQGFRGVLGPYEGERPGKIFSVVFSPISAGSGSITPSNVKMLINDGKGTQAGVSASPLAFSVTGGGSAGNAPARRDLNPPEDFKPEIASDPSIFDGRYFLAFAATDKESGIDHYEVLETRNQEPGTGKWTNAESPYLLEDQTLSSFIFVKAVDKSGNERTEVLKPTHPAIVWYENAALWIIIIAALILIGIAILWKRKSVK